MPVLGETITKLIYDRRNPTIIRVLCLICSLVVYGCIAVEAWSYNQKDMRETCLYNDNGGACTFGLGVGFIAVVASIGFIMGEYILEKTTLIKYRKEYFLFDCGFSGLWSFLYFISFCILTHQWDKVEEEDLPKNAGTGSAKTAIWFSAISIIPWVICTHFAYVRLHGVQAEETYAAEGGLAGASKFPENNAGSMLAVTPISPSVPIPGSAPPPAGLQPFNVAY